MSKTIKPTQQDKCNGCEMCLFEAQRQLKKIGLEESLIRIFRNKESESGKVGFSVEIDPRINALNLEKISLICPKGVFEIQEEGVQEENIKKLF